MTNTNFILEGIVRDYQCENSEIGVDKDLILIEHKYLDLKATKLQSNREIDNVNNNYKGLSNIILKEGAILNVFEGTDYSVVPSVTPEAREDGSMRYVHSLGFTVFSKTARDRETLIILSKVKVVAVVKDRSTGLYELFGMEQGLRVSGLERAYVGSINSNFYSVTIATPGYYVVKESTIGELSVRLGGDTEIVPTPIDSDFLLLLNRAITLKYETTWLGGAQGFSLGTEYSNIENVYVNGVALSDSQYQLTTTSSVTILNLLDANDYIIITYNKL